MARRHTEPRNIIGALIALFGVGAIVSGMFLPWLAETETRPALTVRESTISSLFSGLTLESSALSSVGLIVSLGGLILIVGGLSASRIVTLVGALVTLGACVVWLFRINEFYDVPVNLLGELRLGAWIAIGGALLSIALIFLLRARVKPGRLEAHDDPLALPVA